MGIEGSVFVMFVHWPVTPTPLHVFLQACMHVWIHTQAWSSGKKDIKAICTHSHLQTGFDIPFFDNLTCKRDLMVFSDNINCKSRSQTITKLQLHHRLLLFYRHLCSILLWWDFCEICLKGTIDSILVVICVWQLHQLTVNWVIAMIMKPSYTNSVYGAGYTHDSCQLLVAR